MSLELIAFLSAVLGLLLGRSRELQILAKAPSQRTSGEQKMIKRGLVRSLLLEALIFVPASTILVILITRPIVRTVLLPQVPGEASARAIYAIIGLVSYGFPYLITKRVITTMALKTLKEYAMLVDKEFQSLSEAAEADDPISERPAGDPK